MLLNRLSQSLRQQNWSTLFLELGILVVGILLALQVDNWNQQRKDANQGEELRYQILADLHQTRTDLKRRLEYYQDALDFGEVGLAGLSSNEPVDDVTAWNIVLGTFHAGQIWSYQITGPSYREAQNAGGLSWVGDALTLAALAQVYDRSAHDFELIAGGLPKYREVVRERMPWALQNHIWRADCQETIHFEGEFSNVYRLTNCPAPADAALIQRTLSQFRADQDLQQTLTGRLSQLKISVDSTNRGVKIVERLISILEQPLD